MIPCPWTQSRGPPQNYLDVLNPTKLILRRSDQRSSFYRTLNPTSYSLSGTPVESLPGAQNGKRASKRTFGASCKLVQACIMWECQPHLHVRVICEFDPYVQKFHIHLLSKTLVSKIDQNNGLFSMEAYQRDTLALSQCLKSNGADRLSIRATVMILWYVESHLVQTFKETC